MRQAIFCTLGTKGDLLPYLAVARELHARGNEILVLSSEPYRALCENLGFEFEAIQSTEEHARLLNHPHAWSPWFGAHFYIENVAVATARATFHAIAARVNAAGPACLVTNIMCPGAFFAAEKWSLPLVGVALQPYSYWSRRLPARLSPATDRLIRTPSGQGREWVLRLVEWQIERLFGPLQQLRQEAGLNPRADYFSRQRYSADLNLGLWPEWFSKSAVDWPLHSIRTGFAETEVELTWDGESRMQSILDEKPIVFTMGSEMVQDFHANARLFAAACSDLKKTGLLVSPAIRGQGSQRFGQFLTAVESAPFTQLFPEASVVVSHGGIGTLAKALRAGRPSVVLPMAHDQFDNAFHLQNLGVGFSAPRQGLKRRALVNLLEQALNDRAVLEKGKRLAQKLATERGASTAAEHIQRLMQPPAQLRLGLV